VIVRSSDASGVDAGVNGQEAMNENRIEITSLCDADAAALDALVEAGFGASALSDAGAEQARRAARLVATLRLLDHLPAYELDETLTQRTLSYIAAHELGAAASGDAEAVELVKLCEADQRALDALVECAFDVEALPGELTDRGERVMGVLGALDHLPEESTGDLLVPRTMQAVERARQDERFTAQLESLAMPPAAGGLALRELVTVAACFLLAIVLIGPMLAGARSTAQQIACQAALGRTGVGMAQYAAANFDAMPTAPANLGDPWWEVNTFNMDGTTRSNSAHYFVALRDGAIAPDDMTCPSRALNVSAEELKTMRQWMDWKEADQSSYSYQNRFTTERGELNGGPTIAVFADKNPLFKEGAVNRDAWMWAETPRRVQRNSYNHQGRGQNVLMSNGTVMWIETPRLDSGDNIYHAGDDGFDYYTGTEPPADERDSFLVW